MEVIVILILCHPHCHLAVTKAGSLKKKIRIDELVKKFRGVIMLLVTANQMAVKEKLALTLKKSAFP